MAFVIISDTHHHAWSAFGKTLDNGVNSRNQIILDETRRAGELALEHDAVLIHAGDLFHVRGNIAPSVFNPVIKLYGELVERGLKVVMIPGNHDMEARESGSMTNAVTAMESVGVTVCHAPSVIEKYGLTLVPWQPTVMQLKSILEGVDANKNHSLILHAPIDGVIEGLPDHGLTAEWLASLGFGRVFSGHYHAFKAMDGGVYSIGALTHQTWGDVGTRAGFLFVDDEGKVLRCATHAPSFIDLDPTLPEDDVALMVDGNYVRARVEVERESQIADMREWLISLGAAGVVIHPIKKAAVVSRTGTTVSAGVSLGASVAEFIRLKGLARQEKLNVLCAEILSESEAV
ncbi:metallophosphoesterase family protein [Ectothiorhodospira shaposhnikovii]|uniref:metallophosphoesterase family protein n=1 Tax=Ectothiorhodospira shaposhnikovii TaxID=1054 RepID=UPI001EE99A45|nr:metallophosphoesterase [Ectothiorhodospira shaposhnikovii]MCG5512786.1 metallophosphoesterase [Ectothiorhodospira shaposhnikovii]